MARRTRHDGWYINPALVKAGQVFCWVERCPHRLSFKNRSSVYCTRHLMNLLELGDPRARPVRSSYYRRDQVVALAEAKIAEYSITPSENGMAYLAELVGYDNPASLERALQRAGRNDLVRQVCGAAGTHIARLHASRQKRSA